MKEVIYWILWAMFWGSIGVLACACVNISSRESECRECVWRRRRGTNPVSIENLCIASGAEGFDVRREVAEQLGCEDEVKS